MNWGHKITLVIIFFIIGMLGMVFIAFNQSNEMVDSNYYDKEIKYQSRIDAAKNLNEVSKIDLVLQIKSELIISVPISLCENFSEGNIEFVKNDNQKEDRMFNFLPNNLGEFRIPKSKLAMGTYKVRIAWQSNKISYYKEQNLSI